MTGRPAEAERVLDLSRLVLLISVLGACGADDPADPGPAFVVVEDHGLDFRHDPGGWGGKSFAEINQGGVSLFDANGDGHLDAHFVQGAPTPGGPGPRPVLLDALFLGRGDRSFERAVGDGLHDAEASFAAAVGDVDADGDLDVFHANLGRNRLFLNDGAAHFQVAVGFEREEWSTCACFADFDRDGDADLYVGNYVVLPEPEPVCDGPAGAGTRSYCHPDLFSGCPDRLYRQREPGPDGPRFEDLGAPGPAGSPPGKALALVPFDLDEDGLLDLYVANDSVPNMLWRNLGALRFEEVARTWGVAVNAEGRDEACMGSDLADVDGDGDFDLLSVNMADETDTLWTREQDHFEDLTRFSGLAAPSRPLVGFGARFGDLDLDGDPDLLVAHGHVLDDVQRHDPAQRFAQPVHLYENVGRGRFVQRAVPALDTPRVGRGLALGDLDDDGDLDAVLAVRGGRPVVFENRARVRGRSGDPHWLGLDLGPDPTGAVVEVWVDGELRRLPCAPGAGYAAHHDPRLRIGLGPGRTVDRVVVRWPDGRRTRLERPEVDREHRLRPTP